MKPFLNSIHAVSIGEPHISFPQWKKTNSLKPMQLFLSVLNLSLAEKMINCQREMPER